MSRNTANRSAAAALWLALGLASAFFLQLPAARAQEFSDKVRPVLARHCLGCHNEEVRSAGLNLASFGSDAQAEAHPEIWAKVIEKLETGKMPPVGSPRLAASDLDAVKTWVESLLSRTSLPASAPSPVTVRRLNRAEYSNTVRDLLGIAGRPADDFPVDDSGYGFDNIADVLSLPPMLMEKYMAAAKNLSRLAVYGEPIPAQPATIGHFMAKHSPDARRALSSGGITPFSLRGALYTAQLFPWDAEYEFRFRVVNFRYVLTKRGERKPTEEELKKLFPAVDVVLSVDGVPVKNAPIIGTLAVEFDRGDIVARVPLKAGEHNVRVSFPHLANIDDPRSNVNADERRKLWIDYLDIVGPFQPSKERPESYRMLMPCGHEIGHHQAACLRTAVTNLARRAYRRPVTQKEVDGLLTLARRGESIDEGLRLAVQAVLMSPSFLFRVEKGGEPALSDYELASRLSYFLWSSMPDEELFRAAAGGSLRQPKVLEAQVRRMMADPKATALLDNFAAQWLQLRALDRATPDSERFPKVDEELLDWMRRETTLFTGAIIREDRSVLDFLNAPCTFVNGPLARHYGIPGVDGEDFQRVSLDGRQRGGLLTQGSMLTVSSYPTRTSPVLRGKWVLENLLGAAPPPPPPEVPPLQEAGVGSSVSLRERLEQHRSNALCASCHERMDPIGFGLENYDAVGVWRSQDGKVPIDSSGKLPDGRSFVGPRELINVLAAEPEAFVHNLTVRLLTYALGRGLERADMPSVDDICKKLAANGYKFSTLVLEIVNSPAFRTKAALAVKEAAAAPGGRK